MSNDKKKELDPTSRTQIILAVLTLLGVLGTAIFANWDRIFSRNPVPTPPTSSAETEPPLKTEDLKVYADSTEGISFKNKENLHMLVKFKANSNDRWLAIPKNIPDPTIPEHAKGYLPPRGDLEFQPNKTPCRVPLGALIVVVGDHKECRASGEEGSFELAPGETAYFLMNDVLELYDDNKGFITVKISAFKG